MLIITPHETTVTFDRIISQLFGQNRRCNHRSHRTLGAKLLYIRNLFKGRWKCWFLLNETRCLHMLQVQSCVCLYLSILRMWACAVYIAERIISETTEKKNVLRSLLYHKVIWISSGIIGLAAKWFNVSGRMNFAIKFVIQWCKRLSLSFPCGSVHAFHPHKMNRNVHVNVYKYHYHISFDLCYCQSSILQ